MCFNLRSATNQNAMRKIKHPGVSQLDFVIASCPRTLRSTRGWVIFVDYYNMEDLDNILQKPTDYIRAVIDKELGVADKLDKNVQLMEEWIREQHHLPQDCDSQIIENFVRMTKNNLQKAKAKFEASVVSRTKFKDIYESRSIEDDAFAKCMAHANYCIPPGYTKDGCRIVILHLPDRDPDHADVKMTIKYVTMIGDLQMCCDILTGHIVVVNFANFTASHMKKLNPFDLRKAMYLLQHAYPARVRQIHLVNVNSLTENLVLLVKPFLKEKLRNRIMLHKNVAGLSKFVPVDMLPKDYGGKEKTSREISEDWRRFFAQHTEWSREVDRMKLAGAIPKQKAALYSFDEFSMEGSFRRLSID